MPTNSVNVPKGDVRFFKSFIAKMGWHITPTPNLYDPETEEFVNEQRMKAIEDSRDGKDNSPVMSLAEFKSWADAL